MQNNRLADSKVSLAATDVGKADYCRTPPFLPSEIYPEFGSRVAVSKTPNPVYPLFRQLLCNMGLDTENFGSAGWNPFGEFIEPGNQVLIKPNLVRHIHLAGGNYESIVAHPSVIRCVADYAALALKGRGKALIGDAPVQGGDFDKIISRNHLDLLMESLKQTWDLGWELIDFRKSVAVVDKNNKMLDQVGLSGDPHGYAIVNMGSDSLLAPIEGDNKLFRVTNYTCNEMAERHSPGNHEYLIPSTVLHSDVIINIPKLKTHRKVGLTACLKNLVGINGQKDWLPHHRKGAVTEGGDEYPRSSAIKKLESYVMDKATENVGKRNIGPLNFASRVVSSLCSRIDKDGYFEGSWYGNDTLWRTVLDLNRLLIYADREGQVSPKVKRRTVNFVDAIIAGDGEGPMEPNARHCGLLLGGFNPVAVDLTLASLIGFDFSKIPLISNGFKIETLPLAQFAPEDVAFTANSGHWQTFNPITPQETLSFKPPSGWLGHVEL